MDVFLYVENAFLFFQQTFNELCLKEKEGPISGPDHSALVLSELVCGSLGALIFLTPRCVAMVSAQQYVCSRTCMGDVVVHPAPLCSCPSCLKLQGSPSWPVIENPGSDQAAGAVVGILGLWVPPLASQSLHVNSVSVAKREPGELV